MSYYPFCIHLILSLHLCLSYWMCLEIAALAVTVRAIAKSELI